MKVTWKTVIEKYNEQSDVPLEEILTIIDNKREVLAGHLEIFPPNIDIFKVFNFTEINDVKVVIIGQDPYHAPKQATGLCFAVATGIKVPPSLRNIIKELKSDLDVDLEDTSLEKWAKQGVLMLNASLSVIQGKPASQMKLWNLFTDYVISELNIQDRIIFVAWGAFAHNKLKHIDINKHDLIVSSHPSPLSCYKEYNNFPAFNGSKPFSKINNILEERNLQIINW